MSTIRYREWRRQVFERDNYTCVNCEKRGGALNADHIQPWAYFPELRYEITNGRTLCVKCHRKTYGYVSCWRKINDRKGEKIMPGEVRKGIIAVDLDGTLAENDGWKGIDHIGAPIPAMVARVQRWLAEGRVVVIFTARLTSEDEEITELAKHYIKEWCKDHIGVVLPITNVKHREFEEIWDDHAVGVEKNTGAVSSGHGRFDESTDPGRRVRYTACEHEVPLENFCASCATILG